MKRKSKFPSQKKDLLLPISIFKTKYTPLQAIILHLKQTYHQTNKQIASKLNKSPNSIAVVAKKVRHE